MKVHVEFHDDARTKARITIVPGWLGRLFGAKTRTGEADRLVMSVWQWSATHRNIRNDRHARAILRELDCQTVEPLPKATVRTRPRCTCANPDPLPIREFGYRDPVAWICGRAKAALAPRIPMVVGSTRRSSNTLNATPGLARAPPPYEERGAMRNNYSAADHDPGDPATASASSPRTPTSAVASTAARHLQR